MPNEAAPAITTAAAGTATQPTTPAPDSSTPAKAVKPAKTRLFINDPTPEKLAEVERESGEAVTLDDFIDKAQRETPTSPAKFTPKKTKGVDPVPADAKPETEASEPERDAKPETDGARKKYVVQGKEYELDLEQADRYVQKGIFYEKQGVALKQQATALAARDEELAAREQRFNQIWQALEQDPVQLLMQMHGPDAVREKLEPVLANMIREEALPEADRLVLQERRAREAAEAKALEYEQREQQRLLAQQEEQARGEWERLIEGALAQHGIPKNEETVAEMARWLKRVESRNARLPEAQRMRVTPEDLASHVRNANNERVKALVAAHASRVATAKQAGDEATIAKVGAELVDMLGEELLYSVAQYHLQRLKASQPTAPKKIVEQPRTAKAEPKRRSYMDPDEYAEERRRRVAALERGEDVPEW